MITGLVRAVLPFLICSLAAAQPSRPSPELSIRLPDGNQVLLSKFRGKVVALEFLITTCPNCKSCSSTMNRLYKEYGPRGFQALGAAVEDRASGLVPGYVRALQLTFPVGTVPRRIAADYLRWSSPHFVMPQLVFLDQKGMIRAHYVGGDPFFKDEEKNMRAQIEALLKEAAGAKQPAAPAPRKAAAVAKSKR